MDYSDYFVKVNDKDVMTAQAVWEQIRALSCQVDRARMQARIAMALTTLAVVTTIGNWKNGAVPSIERAHAVAAYFGKTVDEMMK